MVLARPKGSEVEGIIGVNTGLDPGSIKEREGKSMT